MAGILRRIGIAGLLVLPLFAGCVGQHHHLRYDATLQERNGGSNHHLTPRKPVTRIDGAVNLLLGPEAEALSLDHITIDEARLDALFPPSPGEPDDRLAYRFVHFSDIQLRDRGTGVLPHLERMADKKARWTHNNFYQDHGDVFYAAFMVAAIRRLLDNRSHRFVAHTGDSLHINTHSELAAFAGLLERFLFFDPRTGDPCARCWAEGGWLTPTFAIEGDPTPSHRFFNVIGNHDVLRWGSFDRRTNGLLRAHANEIASLAELVAALEELGSPGTRLIDDDLAPPATGADPTPGRSVAYYATDLVIHAGDDTRPGSLARLIFLDVYQSSVKGKYGERASGPVMEADQRAWLEGQLNEAADDPRVDHVLVFGHPPLWRTHTAGLDPEEMDKSATTALESLLSSHPKVIAYFSGHYHSGVTTDNSFLGRRGYPFGHFTVPSLMEFPKILSSVTVRRLTDGSYRIAIRALSLTDLDIVADPYRAAIPSVDVHEDVLDHQQEAFVAWMDALTERCGADAACRARQVALDCMAGARLDKAEYRQKWEEGLGEKFTVEVRIDRD